jgi:uncharacterized protein YkwD
LDDHAGFKGRTSYYLTEKKYHKIAENTAQGYLLPEDIVSAWDKSTGHQATLRTMDMGLGCAGNSEGFAVFIAGKH